MNLQTFAVKTALFSRPQSPGQSTVQSTPQSIDQFLITHIRSHLQPGDIVAITSKIVSIAEGRLVPRESITKHDLILRECDEYLGAGSCGVEITIKEGLLLPSAGIDESNSETEDYLLYPVDPQKSARDLHRNLAKAVGFADFGIILTDSRSLPLRRGITGVALNYWGFYGVHSRVGEPDLFGRDLKATHVNVVDTLAAMAVLLMGEAAECQPLAIVRGAPVEFFDGNDIDKLRISSQDDLFQPLWHSAAGKNQIP